MATQETLIGALQALMVPQPEVRGQGEAFFEQAKTDPNWLVPNLLEVTALTSDCGGAQQMAGVLLRRFLSGQAMWTALRPDVKGPVQQRLLGQLGQHPAPAVRRSVAHCTAYLGARLLAENDWPDLWPTLSRCVADGTPAQQEDALLVVDSLAPHWPDALLAQVYNNIKEMFRHALAPAQPRPVKIAALVATMSTVPYLTSKPQTSTFQALLPQLVQALGEALSAQDWEKSALAVEAFILVADVSPEFFAKDMRDVLAPFLQLAAAETVEEGVRRLGLEFVLSLVESDARNIRKVGDFLNTVIPLTFRMTLTVEHSPEWGVTAPQDDDEDLDFDIGIEAMDRLAMSLKGKAVHPVVGPLILTFAQNSEWKYRHTALRALAQVAEGCSAEFERDLGAIVALATKHTEDPHERVRHAAITAIGQLCTDFPHSMHHTYHGVVMTCMARGMTDACPRVAANAADSVVNFAEDCPQHILEPHLDALLSSLLQLLQRTEHRFVREVVLSTIAHVADRAQKLFTKYYDVITPFLKTIVTAQQVPTADRMLRAKALECISHVAVAVGKERFGPDAPVVLEAFRSIQQSPMQADDPQIQYLIRAWARLARCFGEDFGPYLQLVLPPLIGMSKQTSDVVVTDNAEEVDPDDDTVESMTINLKGIGPKTLTIRTTVLQEKCLAVSTLLDYFEAVGRLMFPYLEELGGVIVPLLQFVYSTEIRRDSAQILPLMVKCLTDHAEQTGEHKEKIVPFVQEMASKVVEAIKKEPSCAVKGAQFLALGAVVEAGPRNCLGLGPLLTIAAIAKKGLMDGLQARAEKKKREEDEEEDAEDTMDHVEDWICQSLDVLISLLKQEDGFEEHFQKSFLQQFAQWASGAGVSPFETRLGLCALASYIEFHGGGAGAGHLESITQTLLRYCDPTYSDPDVVQVACFGLGVCIFQFGGALQGALPLIIPRLLAVVQQKSSDSLWDSAVCNAIHALLKAQAAQSQNPACSAEAILPTVLTALPVKGDEEEGEGVNEKFVGLVEAGHPTVLGANNTNLPAVVGLLKQIHNTDMVNAETNQKIVALLSRLG